MGGNPACIDLQAAMDFSLKFTAPKFLALKEYVYVCMYAYVRASIMTRICLLVKVGLHLPLLSLSLSLSLSFFLSLLILKRWCMAPTYKYNTHSYSLTHTHSLTHSHSHSRTHAHTHSLTICVYANIYTHSYIFISSVTLRLCPLFFVRKETAEVDDLEKAKDHKQEQLPRWYPLERVVVFFRAKKVSY